MAQNGTEGSRMARKCLRQRGVYHGGRPVLVLNLRRLARSMSYWSVSTSQDAIYVVSGTPLTSNTARLLLIAHEGPPGRRIGMCSELVKRSWVRAESPHGSSTHLAKISHRDTIG